MPTAATVVPNRTLSGHRDRVHRIAASPDGATLASADVSSRILVWRQDRIALDLSVRSRFRPWLTNVVRGLAFSGDGREIYVAMADRIRAFDLATAQARWCASAPNILAFLPNPPQDVAVAPNGDVLFTYASGIIELWTAYRARRARWSHNDAPRQVRVLADGKRAVGTNGYSLTMWDLETHALIGRMDPGGHVYGFDASRVRDVGALHYGTHVRLVDFAEGREISRVAVPPGLPVLAFSPKAEALAIGMGPTAAVIDFEGNEVRRTADVGGRIQALTFTAEGKSIAAGNSDGRICEFPFG